MNRVKTDQSNLAITSTFLGFMQDSLAELVKLSALGGDNYILSGCVVTGSSVSAGYIVTNGELLEFKAGNLSTYFLIREIEETHNIQEGSHTIVTRYAEFGVGAEQIAWSSLLRIKNNEELEALIENTEEEIIRVEEESDTADASLQAQIDALTTVVNGIFKPGMIMSIAGDAEDLPVPDGWLLCNGWSVPTGSEFDALRALVGSHTPDMAHKALVGAGDLFKYGDTVGHLDYPGSEPYMGLAVTFIIKF